MFRWIVIEGQQRIAVLDQLGDRLVPFHPMGFDEEVEGDVGFGLFLGLPDVVQMAFGLGLHRFPQRVEYVHRLVDPTALLRNRCSAPTFLVSV